MYSVLSNETVNLRRSRSHLEKVIASKNVQFLFIINIFHLQDTGNIDITIEINHTS